MVVKTEGNIFVGRYDGTRQNCNSTLNAALFLNLIFIFAVQAVLMRNCLRLNSHHLEKITEISAVWYSVGHMSCDA